MALTRVSPSLFATSNNITSVTVGGSANTVSLTFDGSGVITSATNNAISVANTAITGNIISSQITSVANTQITGNIISSQITSVANTQITGVLPITNGGTGAATLAGANIPVTTATNSFTGAQIGSVTALTSSSASIAINLATNNNFSYTTAENSTLAAPSNAVAGQSGIITITQGATIRTLAYNSFYKFAGGTVPALTTTVGAVDVFAYYVESASRATCQLIKDVK